LPGRVVTRIFASWEQIGEWISQLDMLRQAAAWCRGLDCPPTPSLRSRHATAPSTR